ncbi:PIN domain-containing protein [Natrinema gelatinilyticum]|uniref:PIN domain-containing protein n=1 Tax=Natrinema gelatinilyticum TaxID=2961571 RepID=UPI0020C431C8|nr:PIN domain-containing protein [Natrinema gelatinilyticum]
MKVLDATFLVDYLEGVDAATAYLQEHSTERFVIPAPAFAEVLIGEGNGPSESDIGGARWALEWGEVYGVDERTAVTAAEIADEIGPQGPYLAGMDGVIAAVGRELDATVVSAEGDLTHPETQAVVDIEE